MSSGRLGPESPIVNEGASGSLSGGSSSRGNSNEPENRSMSDAGELSNSSTTLFTATTSSSSSSFIANSNPCECQCCANFNIPYHPLAVDSSKRQQLYASKEHGKQKSHLRTIQTS